MRIITLAIISAIGSLAYMIGKFFVYDREYESEGKEAFKLFYIISDVFKDIVVLFMLLNFLLK